MQLIADLHIHSCYSRGCSKDLNIKNLEKFARIKGIDLLGTGDFTHPEWIKEIKKSLSEESSETGSGILRTKTGFPFILQTEISLIYSQGGKGRRVHNIVLAPDLDTVSQISDQLGKRGRLDYDGRPIFKLSCIEFTEMLNKINKDIEVIPAHAWTPWFSVFGSNSGFDSVKEAFGDQLKNIHAIETGLSSDPPMNWRLSQLDRMQILSFSDLHSYWPWRLGREATIFDFDDSELSYKKIIRAIRTGVGLAGTIEVDPAYGKYHDDGHRNCNVHLTPKESIALKNICPKCRKQLTIGVNHRVEELADREAGFRRPDAKKFFTLLPLSELISAALNKKVETKGVWEEYNKLAKLGSELDILLKIPEAALRTVSSKQITDLILTNRLGNIKVSPGFDGVYGVLLAEGVEQVVDKDSDKKEFQKKESQKSLSNY
jgi:uncharacterized protein (TIGR00375 family)